MRPKISLQAIDVNVPGVEYGEFELGREGERPTPFEASLFTLKPGSRTPRDQHAVRECWLVVNGTGMLTYEGEKITISKGELLFFESEKYHFVENIGTEDLTIYSTWWRAHGSSV